MIRRLDTLIHKPWMRRVPRLLTGWICDLYDHSLGMGWDEIRRTRQRRYWDYSQGDR